MILKTFNNLILKCEFMSAYYLAAKLLLPNFGEMNSSHPNIYAWHNSYKRLFIGEISLNSDF